MLKKISLRFAGWGIVVLNLLVVSIEILIIMKFLPFDIIGGGRLETYDAAVQTATVSIIILSINSVVMLIASHVINITKFKRTIKVLVWIFFSYSCLNVVMNLLSKTLFEKIFMTLVTLLIALLTLRLASNKTT